MNNTVWKARVNVSARPGNSDLGDAGGAYTNVLVAAADMPELEERIRAHFLDMGYDVLEVDEPLRFESCLATGEYAAWMPDAALRVAASGELAWDTMYRYPIGDDGDA